jgi:predicted MFS family arabinose efflux permease
LSRVRAGPRRILTVAAPVVATAYLLVPFVPVPAAIGALLVGGLAVAVVMPTLVTTTAERVGAVAAGRMSGYQLVAANVGGTGSSVLIGLIVARRGEGATIWVLIALAAMALPVLLRSVRLRSEGADQRSRSAGSGNDSPGGKRPIDR